MGKLPYIAELHDIGKLACGIARNMADSTGNHSYTKFNFASHKIAAPSSPSWWGQRHMDSSCRTLPESSDENKEEKINVFLTILADHQASSVSRAVMEKWIQGGSGEICRLWNKSKGQGKKWCAFDSIEELKEMFAFIDEAKHQDEFLFIYKKNLELTPEDKNAPRNITTLYTHSELTGKVFRVLKSCCRGVSENGQVYLEYNGTKAKTIDEAEKGWQFQLLKCYVKFHQSLVRGQVPFLL
jgi:hypothetical protein